MLRAFAIRCVREGMSEHQHGIGGKSRVVPSAERNGLLMRSVKSAFALLLTKVTKRIPSLTASGCIGQADILLRSTLLLNDGLRPY